MRHTSPTLDKATTRIAELEAALSATLPQGMVSTIDGVINSAHKPDFIAKATRLREMLSRYVGEKK